MLQLIDGVLTMGYEVCADTPKVVGFSKCVTPNLETNDS